MSGPGSQSTSHREYSAFVDAGSGHTGIICYSYEPSGDSTTLNGLRQIAKDSIKAANGGNLPLTEVMAKGTPESFAEFIDQLRAILDSYRELWQPTLLYVGATGGVRDAVETGEISSADVAAFRSALEAAFGATVRTVKLVVLDGVQEALYETDAAQVIWGRHRATMFPREFNNSDNCVSTIGLFSGGGQSMQLGRVGEAPLSFSFSTFFKEFEEKHGAHADAWLDDGVWGRFQSELQEKIQTVARARQQRGGRFTGAYVCTAMNHRAAMYCKFAERPIGCAEAIGLLKAALPQFRAKDGPLYDDMVASTTGGAASKSYPLARIVACHTFRLCATLEALFSPDAQLYFARNGTDRVAGDTLECEWTLGACMAQKSGE